MPLVSFALLKGRCRGCRAPIPRRALLAELAVLALTLHAATVLSGWPLIAAAVLAALLVALTLTDLEARIIPDEINGMLALAGLCVIWARAETVLWHHLAAGAGGALFFWLLAEGYGRLRGRDVLGGGDVKFLGAAGLWTGPLALPTLLVWASASGLLAAGIAALRGARIGPDTEMPFGPFLAAGLWLAWLYGPIGM
jgi:leader peptidase (prepilin peptidase)/N-methyltransferase